MTRLRAIGLSPVSLTVWGQSGPAPVPFFATRASRLPRVRRMLLVSYAFTPSVEIGARRWHSLSAFAVKRGWEVDVLTVSPDAVTHANYSLMQELQRGIRVFAVPAFQTGLQRADRAMSRFAKWLLHTVQGNANGDAEASRIARSLSSGGDGADTIFRQLRRTQHAALFFQQADDWTDRAVFAGLSLHREQRYDLILSSGPPHMAHVAARRIARSTDAPLVIDLRDPIALPEVEPPELKSALWRARMQDWERDCVSQADLIAVTSEGARVSLLERYPDASDRVLTVMNGADPDVRIEARKAESFIIANTGTIYMGRDPRTLFMALASVVSRRGLGPDKIRLHFMGDTSHEGVPLEHLAAQAGVPAHVAVEPLRPRAEAHALLGLAAMAVILPQWDRNAIPAKLFEYVMAPTWLLALADAGSAVDLVLRGSQADVFNPSDVDGIARAIESRYDAFCRGERPQPLNHDGRFDRGPQADKLFSALDALI